MGQEKGQIVGDCILNMILQEFDSETIYPMKSPTKCHWWRGGLVDEALAAYASGVGFRSWHQHKKLEMEAHSNLSVVRGDGDRRIPGVLKS